MDEKHSQIWHDGWEAYFEGLNQCPWRAKLMECPNYPTQEEKDEWMRGWIAARDYDTP